MGRKGYHSKRCLMYYKIDIIRQIDHFIICYENKCDTSPEASAFDGSVR